MDASVIYGVFSCSSLVKTNACVFAVLFHLRTKENKQPISALLCIAAITKPYILAIQNILRRRNKTTREKDWNSVKKVIDYLKTTKDFKLIIN